MTALERAALAVCNEMRILACQKPLPYIPDGADREHLSRVARAVLTAVRDELPASAVRAGCIVIEDSPTIEETDPRFTDGYDFWIPAAEQTFTAMVDAILKEESSEAAVAFVSPARAGSTCDAEMAAYEGKGAQ